MRHFGMVLDLEFGEGRNRDIGGRPSRLWRAQRAIFSRISAFKAPKRQNFAGLRALTEPWADS